MENVKFGELLEKKTLITLYTNSTSHNWITRNNDYNIIVGYSWLAAY